VACASKEDFPMIDGKYHRAKIARSINSLSSCGFALLGTPYVTKLRGNLFELRIGGGRDHRTILFHWNGDGLVLLHASAKQTNKTPRGAIAVA
jgi:phage-related protein